MDIQIVALAAVREVMQRKPVWGPRNEPMMYVISRCPDRERKIGHLYGTLPWDQSHGTRDFRERHCTVVQSKGARLREQRAHEARQDMPGAGNDQFD